MEPESVQRKLTTILAAVCQFEKAQLAKNQVLNWRRGGGGLGLFFLPLAGKRERAIRRSAARGDGEVWPPAERSRP